MTDKCDIGTNGCLPVQEIQKSIVSIKTTTVDNKEDIKTIFELFREVNKTLLKHAFILGSVVVLIELAFKFLK